MLHSSVAILVDLSTGRMAVSADPDVRAAALAWARARKPALLALARRKASGGRVMLTTADLAALATPPVSVTLPEPASSAIDAGVPPGYVLRPDWTYVITMLTNKPANWERALEVHAVLHRCNFDDMIAEAQRRIEEG